MPDEALFEEEQLHAVTDLELDPYNPRLPRRYRGASQEELLDVMIRLFDVLSLAEAIATAGYLDFDPLAGFRLDGPVVRIREGNRRVAAAKLLLAPELAPSRYARSCQELATRLDEKTRADLSALRVQVWRDAEAGDLNAYIGYRHVTGVRPWPPVEKARFIAYLVDEESATYAEIAERIGSKPRHVERHYLAYQLVEQAIADEVPGAEQMEDSFGVLLRSLQARGIAEFLGVTYTGNPSDAKRPVPDGKLEQLREFVLWTFGSEDVRKVLRDSRDLTRWAKILESETALAYLRRTPDADFERAWERSGGEAQSLADLLLVAADNLREAVPIVGDHLDDEDVRQAVAECARFFMRMMREFPELAAEHGLPTNA